MSRPISAVHFIDVTVTVVGHLVGIVHCDMATNSCFFWSKCRNQKVGVVAQVK